MQSHACSYFCSNTQWARKAQHHVLFRLVGVLFVTATAATSAIATIFFLFHCISFIAFEQHSKKKIQTKQQTNKPAEHLF